MEVSNFQFFMFWAVLFAAVLIVLWYFRSLIMGVEELIALRKCKSDLRAIVINSQPSWEELKCLAPTWGLTLPLLQRIIRRLYLEGMVGREKDLHMHKDLLKGYISEYRRDEPFAELPSEISIIMERLRDDATGKDHLLEALTSQIKEILSFKKKESRILKYYTIGGFFVGFVGLVSALYQVIPIFWNFS